MLCPCVHIKWLLAGSVFVDAPTNQSIGVVYIDPGTCKFSKGSNVSDVYTTQSGAVVSHRIMESSRYPFNNSQGQRRQLLDLLPVTSRVPVSTPPSKVVLLGAPSDNLASLVGQGRRLQATQTLPSTGDLPQLRVSKSAGSFKQQ